MPIITKQRQCQPCTACCDGWLAITISGYDVRPGRPCPYSTGAGCSDYIRRPVDPCRKFNCGWVMDGSPLPEWMQPNLSRVIVMPRNMDDGQPVLIATPVGLTIPQRSLDWLIRFVDQHRVPLLYTEQILDDGKYTRRQGFRVHAPDGLKDRVIRWMESGKVHE